MNSSTDKGTVSEYQDNLEKLREIPFFSGLPLEPVKVIAYLCIRETFEPGDTMFAAGESDGNAYLLLTGSCSMYSQEDEDTPIGSFGAGSFLGALSLLGDMKRIFTVKAAEPAQCIILTREKFQKILEQFPGIMPQLFQSVVEAVYEWEARFMKRHADECMTCKSHMGVSLI